MINEEFKHLCELYQSAKTMTDQCVREQHLRRFMGRCHEDFWDVHHSTMCPVKPNVLTSLPAIGQACFPVVMGQQGKLYRVIVRWIDGTEDILPDWTSQAMASSEASETVAEYLTRVLARFRKFYSQSTIGSVQVDFEVEPEFETTKEMSIHGRSMGLAVYVALESLKSNRPIGASFIFTGAIVSSDRIGRVGDIIPHKLNILKRWRPRSILLTPHQNQELFEVNIISFERLSDVEKYVFKLPSSWKARYELLEREHNPLEKIRIGVPLLKEIERQAPSERDDDNLIKILGQLVAAYNRVGRSGTALELIKLLDPLLAERDLSQILEKHDWMELIAHFGISFLDELKLEEGLAYMDRYLPDLGEGKMKIHFQGTKAKLLMAGGDHEGALSLYESNLKICETGSNSARKETVRTLCYLGDLFRVLKRYDDAEAQFEKGLRLLSENEERYDGENKTNLWLKWNCAKLTLDKGLGTDIVKAWQKVYQDWSSFEEVKVQTKVKSMEGALKVSLLLAYPMHEKELSQSIETFKHVLHPENKLYRAIVLRAKAQYHRIRGESIPETLLSELRAMLPQWSTLTYSEIWACIPY